ncbi:MAG: ADOP family duplicated permease [Longimicrobiales bacterium]
MPAAERLLAGLLIRGPGADFVIGDLAEGWHHDRSGLGARRARRRLRRRVLASARAWWTPRAWRARRRAVRDGSGRRESRPVVRRGGDGMGGWTGDARYAVRTLIRRPVLALGVVLTLGLGVGATTAIYSVVDTVLLRPLDYEDSGRLVAVGTTFPGREWSAEADGLMHLAGTSYLNFVEFEGARAFEALGGLESAGVLVPDQGNGPELVTAARVTEGFWRALRVSPALGRLFHPGEYVQDEDAGPVLLSHGAWTRRFGADPGVLGRTLGSAGGGGVIVGVLPPGFRTPEVVGSHTPEFWMPLQGGHPRYASRGRRSLVLIGRLADGATVEDARAEMTALADRLAADHPDGNVYPDGSHFGAGVNGLLEETVGPSARVLVLFLGAAGLLLLIAVLNATTLLTARALDRSTELGVRMALGAGSARVVRLLLAESVVLSVAGGALGALVGYAGVEAFVRYGPASLPRMDEVAVDARVLAVTLAVALVSGIAAGLLPALRVRRGTLAGLHARGGREAGTRMRNALVTLQLAVAVLLLSGAGVLFHSFVALRSADPGFQPAGLMSFQMGVKRPGAPEGEETWQAWDRILEEVRATPGVTAAAAASNVPFQSPYWAPRVLLPGEPDDTRRDGVAGYVVTPGYVDVLGVPLRQGRDFARTDGPDGPWVAWVNEAWVRDHHPTGTEVLGSTLRMIDEASQEWRDIQVVGVVGDVVQSRPEEGARPAVYLPYTQADWPLVQPLMAVARPPEVMAPEIRRSVARFSGMVPVQALMSLEDRIRATRTSPRFHAVLLGTFAAVALLLASAGLYASLAHAVGRRRRELGIRMALGARRQGLRGMVMLQAARTAGLGIALGLGGALLLNRTLRSYLFEVQPDDPVALTAAAAVLAVVALAAAYLPARRATSVDPAEVLRAE